MIFLCIYNDQRAIVYTMTKELTFETDPNEEDGGLIYKSLLDIQTYI